MTLKSRKAIRRYTKLGYIGILAVIAVLVQACQTLDKADSTIEPVSDTSQVVMNGHEVAVVDLGDAEPEVQRAEVLKPEPTLPLSPPPEPDAGPPAQEAPAVPGIDESVPAPELAPGNTTDAPLEAAPVEAVSERAAPPPVEPAGPVKDKPPADLTKTDRPGSQKEPNTLKAPIEPAPAAEDQVQSGLDMDGLATQLRKTKAIGVFTKLELKSQVNDLLEDVKAYHGAKGRLSLSQLEQRFNLLVMKLLVLLEEDDPGLHNEIARARISLWSTLADPGQFSSLQGI